MILRNSSLLLVSLYLGHHQINFLQKVDHNIKKKYPFILILDEAHGKGVFGKTGAGLAEEMQVQDQVDIIIGTLGKSLASMGAYVLSNSSTIIEYLVNYAGEFIY